MDKGWTQPSTSPYDASLVGASSKPRTAETGVCSDYCRVNAMTKDTRFPMKNVKGAIAQLAMQEGSLCKPRVFLKEFHLDDERAKKLAVVMMRGLWLEDWPTGSTATND